ncbi:MAG: hypothetical protein DMG95_04120 [Acidobacteria bacterium]|nr:MAG: hypothetical protein DMG95_04120 [Acidobacteriota bacterium]
MGPSTWSAGIEHYTHDSDCATSGEELSAKNPKPPFQAALDSWVELLKLSGRRWPLSMRTLAVYSVNDELGAIAQKY